METCQQRMERIDAKKRIADFMVKEQLPYEFKVKYARVRVQEFVRECEKRDLNYHVSVGGLDSITLGVLDVPLLHGPGNRGKVRLGPGIGLYRGRLGDTAGAVPGTDVAV